MDWIGLVAAIPPWVGWGLLALWLLHYTWTLFAAVMNVKRVRNDGTITPQVRAMGGIALALGSVLNAGVNIFICTLLFLELPREVMTSKRLWRLSQGGGRWPWQQHLAEWLRSRFLDWLDPGGKHRA